MIKQVILIGCVIFGFVLLLIYIFQRHLIYFPDRHIPDLKAYHAQDMDVVTLKTKDNLTLKSWYKPAAKNQPTLLYLHGNAGNIGYRMTLARKFLKAGLGVFLLEYRGYGGNRGSPNEQGFYEDGQTALDFLQEQGIKPSQLVLYGESLGTGVATKLGSEHAACAIILQSPFTSLPNVARYHYPWVLMEPWDKYNSLERIKTIHTPLLVLHGKLDRIIPYTDGLALFDAANEPKKMLTFPNKDHNNLWSERSFSNDIIQFIEEHCN
ncbi:alpha/beta hydrolase [Legionella shakespearei]|uniref:Alpha/beta hydrolase family protein n=1 Tax=Legionella shakespearei DSM 23087 TaxID=1122169 RepID=A0A0W0YZL3_9GAMM|nr:alpha/beta hydrolase [Legionella shakespearei]KTD62324.1 Alpha/beta hydrolase family protein [Legionella shakespearei DSM 23087]